MVSPTNNADATTKAKTLHSCLLVTHRFLHQKLRNEWLANSRLEAKAKAKGKGDYAWPSLLGFCNAHGTFPISRSEHVPALSRLPFHATIWPTRKNSISITTFPTVAHFLFVVFLFVVNVVCVR